jgi:Putative auto-transporter adhesin, head GIN domain
LTNGQFITERVQGSGDMVSETRDVQGFDRVRFDAFGNLEIVQGEQEGLVIETQPNLLPYLTSEVRGDQLVIEIKPHVSITPLSTIRYQLRVKDLRDLEVSGAGFIGMNSLNTDRLIINSSGAAGVTISDLLASTLDANLSGTGKITVSGTVDTLQVDVNGAGSFYGAELSSKDADVALSGLGGATVWMTDSLDAQVSGVGSIQYYGNPAVTKKVSGIGSVVNKGDK